MAIFDYKCSKCGDVTEHVLLKAEGSMPCPKCGQPAKRIFSVGNKNHGETHEMWSVAMGINPDQIPEMKKRFPHHEYHPVTGDLKVKNYQHQKQLAKELGMCIK